MKNINRVKWVFKALAASQIFDYAPCNMCVQVWRDLRNQIRIEAPSQIMNEMKQTNEKY